MMIARGFAYSSDRFLGRITAVALAEYRTIYVDTELADGIDVRDLMHSDCSEALA